MIRVLKKMIIAEMVMSKKTRKTTQGEIEIEVPRDRGWFITEPTNCS